jgi:hypothetical protein
VPRIAVISLSHYTDVELRPQWGRWLEWTTGLRFLTGMGRAGLEVQPLDFHLLLGVGKAHRTHSAT